MHCVVKITGVFFNNKSYGSIFLVCYFVFLYQYCVIGMLLCLVECIDHSVILWGVSSSDCWS